MAKQGKYVVELFLESSKTWTPSGNLKDYGGPYFSLLLTARRWATKLAAQYNMTYRAVPASAQQSRQDFVQSVVDKVKFPDYTFRVVDVDGVALFIQGEYIEADTVTGAQELQKTRLWLVADNDTEDEIVRTMFKIIMTSMEHKAREWFKYEGYSIMNPHFSVQQYKAIMEAKDVRGK